MKKIKDKIAELESKLALDYNEYKKLHPKTKKTPSDPMFKDVGKKTKKIDYSQEVKKIDPSEVKAIKEYDNDLKNISKRLEDARKNKSNDFKEIGKDYNDAYKRRYYFTHSVLKNNGYKGKEDDIDIDELVKHLK